MSCCTNQLIMLLQLVLFVLLSTTTLMQCSYGFSSLANDTNLNFAGNNDSRFVTLDQLSAYVVMDLTGSIYERFYEVMINLGEHAREYSFLIDTGSDLTWVNSDFWQTSYHYPHQPYNPPVRHPVLCGDPICSHVEHPKENPCNNTNDRCFYIISYIDGGTTKGDLILDSLAFRFTNVAHSHLPPSIKIGCGLDNSHPRGNTSAGHVTHIEFDGILGLAKKSPTTIIDQLVNKGIMRPVFGHCMSTRGGNFFMGAGKVLPHGITWAPMVTLRDETHYSLGRAHVIFDGTTTDVKSLYDTIFDSGSTFSYFKTRAVEALIRRVKANLVGKPLTEVHVWDYPICWRSRGGQKITSVEQVAHYFKTMTLTFPAANNVRFELPPYTYLTVEPSESDPQAGGDVCFTIFDARQHGLGELNVIGDNFFQKKLVIYDLDRNRIGWAPSNCNSRGTNDRKRHHVTDREYRRRDLSRHRFSSNIPVQLQPPLANYTSIHQTMN